MDEAGPPAWSEGIAAALDRLPWVYTAVLAGAVLTLLLVISAVRTHDGRVSRVGAQPVGDHGLCHLCGA